MDHGSSDDIVSLRHDMRNASGGLLIAVLGISSPEGGGKTGPFRTDAEVLSGADDIVGVRVMLFDEGQGGRAVTAASYQYRPTA